MTLQLPHAAMYLQGIAKPKSLLIVNPNGDLNPNLKYDQNTDRLSEQVPCRSAE